MERYHLGTGNVRDIHEGTAQERRQEPFVRAAVDVLTRDVFLPYVCSSEVQTLQIRRWAQEGTEEAQSLLQSDPNTTPLRMTRFGEAVRVLQNYVRPILEFEAYKPGYLFTLGAQHLFDLSSTYTGGVPLAAVDIEVQKRQNPWLDVNKFPSRLADITALDEYFQRKDPIRNHGAETNLARNLLKAFVLYEMEKADNGKVEEAIQRLDMMDFSDITRPETILGRYIVGGLHTGRAAGMLPAA